MFDIGFLELLVIVLIGLIILGPDRLPRAVRSIQEKMRTIKQFGSRIEAEINHELRIKELHDNLRKIESSDDLENLPDDLKKSFDELKRAAASVNQPYAQKNSATAAKQPKDMPTPSVEKSTEQKKEPGNDAK